MSTKNIHKHEKAILFSYRASEKARLASLFLACIFGRYDHVWYDVQRPFSSRSFSSSGKREKKLSFLFFNRDGEGGEGEKEERKVSNQFPQAQY